VIETNYGFHLVDIEMIVSENAQTAEAQGRMQIAKELMLAVETEKLISETAKHIQESAQKGTALQQAIDTVLAKLDEERGIKKKAAKKEEEETPTEPGRPFIETTASFSQLDGNPIDGVARGQNVVEMAFRLSKPGEVGSDLVRLNNGYAVIQLKERTSASREDFDKERHEYAARLLYVKQQDLLVSYIEQLRKAAEKEITIAEKWVQEPKRRSGSDDDE
jgi:peptidyl-prolyl cis-trans isomerase D